MLAVISPASGNMKRILSEVATEVFASKINNFDKILYNIHAHSAQFPVRMQA